MMASSLGLLSFVVFLCMGSPQQVRGELFTAMADFEETLVEERVVLDSVEQYIKKREAKLDVLRKFSEECKKSQTKIESDMRHFWHPISIFHQIRRMTDGWETVMSVIRDESDANDIITNITQHRSQDGIQFPTDEDVVGAAVGLFRLQDTYSLDTHEIAEGRIPGVEYSPKLTALECYELALAAYENKHPDYYHAMLWLQEAYDRVQTELEPTIDEASILDYLSYALFQQTNLERAAFVAKKLRDMDPTYSNVEENLAWYTKELKAHGVADTSVLTEGNLPPLRSERGIRTKGGKEFLTYESLCRGENNKKPTPDMNCYFKKNNPFLRLAPLRVEVLHLRPKIMVFRDAISPSESLLVRQLGGPKLARAMIANVHGELEPANYRISKSGWLADGEHGTVERISRRIEDMTDLTCKTAEALQIANYGIGGHYEAHFDFAQKHEKNSFKRVGAGNRIATVLFYLTEPSAGGATIFTSLNLTLYPTENDAVVWYNLYKSGEGDLELKHAACPVLSGVKWVANKWLHEHGQEWHRPCALNKLEYE